MKLHEISVKRPIAVSMVILIFVVIGIYSMSMLPIEMMPEMEMTYAMVYTSYSNVGSAEVENLVTKNIESAISTVSGIDTIQSQSSEGSSIVMASFDPDTDMDKAVNSMKEKIDLIEDYLPDECDAPMVMKLDTSMMSAAMMSISYEGYDLIATKQFAQDFLVNKLESVEGVASVSLMGARDRIIEVELEPERLYGYDLGVSSIMSAIASQNSNMPAGTTEAMKKDMSVRVLGKFSSLKDIENVPVSTPTGQLIYLKDVANVKDTFSDQTSVSRLNGVDSISITINAESDANTVDVVNGITKVLEDTKKAHPKFTYNMTMEQGSYIEESISSVASNAISGAILAILILLLFLGNIKTSLIVGISMPISVFTTFIGMYFSGMSLNVVSLGGLALGVGMLVDNSVVVIENIYRRKTALGESSEKSAINGAGQVIGAVVASVITTCIVYVPIMFIDNMMAIMFKQLALSIIFSQIASLIITFLLIPMFTSKIPDGHLRNEKLSFVLDPFENGFNRLYELYEKTLRLFLKNTKKVIWSTMAIFLVSLIILGSLGMTLMPSTDEGILTVSISTPQGTTLENTDKLTLKAEEILREHDDIETMFSSVGSSGAVSAIMGGGANSSSITVTLKENRNTDTDTVCQEIRELFSDFAGAEISVKASNSAMSSMVSDELSFEFTSNDEEKLNSFITNAKNVLAGIEGVTESSSSLSETKSEVRINLDSNRAASYGFNSVTLSSLVKYALDGGVASRYTEGGSEYDIKLVYPKDYVKNYNELKNFLVKAPTGQWVALSDVADITIEQGQSTLTRVDQKRVVTLNAKIYGTNMSKVTNAFNKEIAKVMPEGVSMNTSGSVEVMMDAMKSLLVAILLGILLMYFVMAAQFENLMQPFIILFTVPLAIIGVVFALFITGSSLSVVGCIGILMLIGIIVNNAIVLIDFVNTSIDERFSTNLDEILVEATKVRLRPILMTSLTSVLGFLPMALSSSGGSKMMQPLAIVLVGGLFVGTLLTLFIIPVVFKTFESKRFSRLTNKW